MKLKQPIAHIQARHSSTFAKTITADDMCGLVPTLYLARNALVMLTLNLWPEVVLCNGATGKVIDIIYAENDFPPSLPISVIVQFHNYKSPSFVDTLPNIAPICPITITAWAITIHKSQGLTLPKAWITGNLGTSEKTAGITYVAISRIRTLDYCVIEPMTFDQLKNIKDSSQLRFQIEEEIRLNDLATAFLHKD